MTICEYLRDLRELFSFPADLADLPRNFIF
jgi:hypothetical protein